MSDEPFQGWIASLSDGRTIFEEVTDPGEISRWQQLLKECRETEDLEITQVRLQRHGITIIGQAKARGYCAVYEARAAYKVGPGGGMTKQTILQGIGTVVGANVFVTWVNDQGHVWHDIRTLDEMKVHCNLKS